jgi:hypothetical protein
MSSNERFAFGRAPGEVIQYAYTVPDVRAAIAVHVEPLAVGPWFVRGPFSPAQARYRGEPTEMTITLARAFAGDSMIELIQQHNTNPSVYTEVIGKRGHGFHHWAIGTRDLDREVERYAAYGYPVALEETVPSGARIVYMDATRELPGMIELIEMTEAQERLLTHFYRAAAHWDGNDLIREG